MDIYHQSVCSMTNEYEPWHDKSNKCIHPVWSEPSLCAHWVAKDPSFLHADSKDSDQTGRMPRLIWVFAGRTCHFLCFVMRRLNYLNGLSSSQRFGLKQFVWPRDLSGHYVYFVTSPIFRSSIEKYLRKHLFRGCGYRCQFFIIWSVTTV